MEVAIHGKQPTGGFGGGAEERAVPGAMEHELLMWTGPTSAQLAQLRAEAAVDVASSAVEDVRRSRASRGDVEDEEDSTLTRSSAATTATATRPSTRYEKMTTPDGVEVTMC